MFSKFEFLDTSLSADITKDNEDALCPWFTLSLGTYRVIDRDTGEEKTIYDYLSFPVTACKQEHLKFYSSDVPYYSLSFPGAVEDLLELEEEEEWEEE